MEWKSHFLPHFHSTIYDRVTSVIPILRLLKFHWSNPQGYGEIQPLPNHNKIKQRTNSVHISWYIFNHWYPDNCIQLQQHNYLLTYELYEYLQSMYVSFSSSCTLYTLIPVYPWYHFPGITQYIFLYHRCLLNYQFVCKGRFSWFNDHILEGSHFIHGMTIRDLIDDPHSSVLCFVR